MELDDLRQMLRAHNVDFPRWGNDGGIKQMETLLEEIRRGDCYLTAFGGNIVLEVQLALITVTYKNMILAQVREDNLPPQLYSICKVIPGKKIEAEDCTIAAMKAVKEMLGITVGPLRLMCSQGRKNERPSITYPGVRVRSSELDFGLMLRDEEFNQAGYRKKFEDKVFQFTWKV
jgi:hypothetical protein